MNRSIAWLSLFGVVACASGDPTVESRELPGPQSLEACPELDTSPCDIDKKSCRERLLDVACCVYECPGKTPSIETERIDTNQWRQRLLDADESSEDFTVLESVFVPLGLVANGGLSSDASVDYYAENIIGYYDNDSKVITVIQHEDGDDLTSSSTFVHEAIHALQDRDHDLAALNDAVQSIDESLALSSVVEGEARFLEYRAILAMQGLRERDVDLAMATQADRQFAIEWLVEQDEPYLPSLSVLRYSVGVDWARSEWERDGMKALGAALDSPPQSTLHVLEEVLDGEPSSDTELTFLDPPEVDEEAGQVVWSARFGPWLPYLLYRLASSDSDLARSVALSYRGDLLSVIELASGEYAWRWDFAFDQKQAPLALEASLADRAVTLSMPTNKGLTVTGAAPPSWLLP